MKVQVRQCRTASKQNRQLSFRNQLTPRNWQVRQTLHEGGFSATRVFTYSMHFLALQAAEQLARFDDVHTFGLRGFHIEYH